MSDTLFEKYGGFATIGDVVHSFYEKIMDTESLEHYFWDVDMNRLMAHQTDFLAMVLGGPSNYSGRSLKEAHRHLKITVEDFLTVAELLEEALEEAGMEDQDIEMVIGIVASTKDDIVFDPGDTPVSPMGR